MKRSIVIAGVIIGVVLVFASLISMQPTARVTAKKEVKVGAILYLTGDLSLAGTAFQRGIELAREELNEKNDIYYTVIFEDEGSIELVKAVQAGRKLTELDRVHVVIIAAASEAKALSSIFEPNEIPSIVLWDSNDDIAHLGNYTFSLGFSTDGAARSMAKFAYHNLSVRSASVVYTFDDWSNLIAEEFKKAFETEGGNIILFEGTNIDEKDFRTFITKSKPADAIYTPLLFPSTAIRQAREIVYSGYILAADSLTQDQIGASKNLAEEVYHTNIYVSENEKLRKLVEKYEGKYGEEPEVLALTAIGYDAMHAIDAAVRAKGIGREQIKEGLYEIRIEGATGVVDFDETGMAPRFERIFVVKDGKAVLAGG